MALRFSKMHGLGNDFVLVDCRQRPFALDAPAIRRLGDRHFGVGFDQLLTIEPARDASCAFAYRIWNTDGTPSGQCGNGLRCVARWLARAGAIGEGVARLQSPSGAVTVELLGNGDVRADMGEPRFDPRDIPINASTAIRATSTAAPGAAGRIEERRSSQATADTADYTIDIAGRTLRIGAVSIGNPHALLEVDDTRTAEVAVLGPRIGQSPAFPEGCNVGFARVVSRGAIELRVWERGVGETLACGSGACAAVAVLRQRGQLDADVDVTLPGGVLGVHWQGPGHALWMSGPAAFVFEGEWDG